MAKVPSAKRLEKVFGVTLPERLHRFFDEEVKAYKKKRVFGLPHFSADTKMKVGFGHEGLPHAIAYALEFQQGTIETRFPLAALDDMDGGTFFMSVDLTQSELPVAFFDYESGFHPHADSFDAFLAGLIDKDDKTPMEKLQDAHRKAVKVVQKKQRKKYRETIETLRPVLELVLQNPPGFMDGTERYLGQGLNLLGILHNRLDEHEDAARYWEQALERREYRSGLNLVSLYMEDFDQPERALALAEELSTKVHRMVDDYSWHHLRRYRGQLYIRYGREKDAVLAYHQVSISARGEHADRLEGALEELEELAKGEEPGRSIAERILRWIRPVETPVEPERAQSMAEAWARVPTAVQAHLRERAGVESDPPSPLELRSVFQLERMDLKRMELTDLSFLAPFERLVRLDLEANRLKSLESLPELPSLSNLDLGDNALERLDGLARVPHLEKLDVASNPLGTLDGIEVLRELKDLRAKACGLTDLRPLAGLPALEELTVYNNEIEDLSPLARCPRLKEISFFGNPVKEGLLALAELPMLEDYDEDEFAEEAYAAFEARRRELGLPSRADPNEEELASMRSWWDGLDASVRTALGGEASIDDDDLTEKVRDTTLRLVDKGLTDLEWTKGLDRLHWLNVSENPIQDLSPLASQKRLRELLVRKAKLSSLESVRALTDLLELDVEGNQLTSLSGLEGLLELEELSAEHNQIRDISPLAGLRKLRILYLEHNQVESLAPLAQHTALQTLWVQDNQITDLSPLGECRSLRRLVCFANPGLRGLEALKGLPNLRFVRSHGSLSDEALADFRAARPDVEVT